MIEYNYILEPYEGMKSRHTCPQCGKKGVYSKYISVDTKEYISDEVGRCNREDKCGYHYTPKDYFRDNSFKEIKTLIKPINRPSPKPISYIPIDLFKQSLQSFEENNFVNYLINLLGKEETEKAISRYFVGTSNHWNGATIFYQIDLEGKIRTGKIMLYDWKIRKK